MFLLGAIYEYYVLRKSINKAPDFLSDKIMTSTTGWLIFPTFLCNIISQNTNFTSKVLSLLQQRI